MNKKKTVKPAMIAIVKSVLGTKWTFFWSKDKKYIWTDRAWLNEKSRLIICRDGLHSGIKIEAIDKEQVLYEVDLWISDLLRVRKKYNPDYAELSISSKVNGTYWTFDWNGYIIHCDFGDASNEDDPTKFICNVDGSIIYANNEDKYRKQVSKYVISARRNFKKQLGGK